MATASQIRALLAQRSTVSVTALTTTGDTFLERADEIQINWRDALRILDDALTSVSHEGQFRSSKVREALPLIEVALEALAESAGLAEQRLARSHVTWFDQLFCYLPGSAGDRARLVFSAYQRDTVELARLNELIHKVRKYREDIATAIDTALNETLLNESEDYRELRVTMDRDHAEAGRAESLLLPVSGYVTGSGIEAAVDFYVSRELSPMLPELDPGKGPQYKFQHNKEALNAGLRQHATELRARANVAESRMRAMRNELKAKIYGSSE